jgi:ATP-dependent protease Clp ATPase subunit
VDKDKCSFCGKSERFGVRLVRGPKVAICEECVALATEVLEGMPESEHPEGRVQVRAFRQAEARGVESPPSA